MKNSINLVTIVLALTLLSGCASVQIYSGNDLKNKTGLKFYSVKPYLLVEMKSEKDQTIKTTIVYLPDLANPLYLNVKPGIGSNELKLAFTNGILNSYGLTSDGNIPETINSLAALISKGSDAVVPFTSQGGIGKVAGGEVNFELFEINISPEGTRLRRVSSE